MGLFDFLFGKKKEHERQMKQQILQEEQERRWREEERARREKLFPWEADMRRRAECAAEAKKAKESKVHSTGHLLFLKELVSDAFFAYRHVTNTSKYPTYMWAEKELYLGDESKIAYFVPFWWIRTLAKSNLQKFNETMDLLNNDFQINVQGFDVDEVVKRIRKNGFYQFQPDFDVNVNKTLLSKLFVDSACMLRLINFFGDHIKEEDILPSQTKRVNIASASPAVNEVINEMLDAYRKGGKDPNFKEPSNSTHIDTFKDAPSASVTKVTDEHITNGVKDEFGAIYSPDGKRLLKGIDSDSYSIKPGTQVICDEAFLECPNLISVTIPDSVTHIGDDVFIYCNSLSEIRISAGSFDQFKQLLPGFESKFRINEPTKPAVTKVSTYRSEEDINCGVEDEFGALYSPDGKKLLFGADLNSYTIKPGTQVICDQAFHGCRSLTSIVIPNSVTHIGDHAFFECNHLTGVFIPNSVIHIGNSAFNDCSALRSITIPDSVTRIGGYSFYGCSALRSINIPDSVTEIEEGTFSECKALTSITIPNSVTHIGDDAFNCCLLLKSITIPNSVTHIGDRAFYYCNVLTCIVLPDSVTHIGDEAFYECYSLGSISLPNSLVHIGDRAFYECGGLIDIIIPSMVTHIGKDAFYWSGALTSIRVKSLNNTYDSRGNCNAIIHTATNTLILGCKNTIIPNSVTHIEDNAFFHCYGMTNITIPNSVTHIGNKAFYECKDLTSITIPNSVKHIGDEAFSECSALASISIPNLVTRIGDQAYYGCYRLASIIIPDSVTHIGIEAFCGCSGLTNIIIPPSVTYIGDGAFHDCGALTSLTLPNSVTRIGYSTFYDCEALTNIIIPNSVTHIGDAAFYGCEALTSITIPDSVISIGKDVFGRCNSLSEIHIPVGGYDKFKKLLPDLEDKFVED